jgi:hypothetical protein
MQRPKENPVRSKAYLRLVAALPCAWCGISGISQAAHMQASGKGIKTSDLTCVPLCSTRPGVPGCHQDADQYKLGNKADTKEMMAHWAKQTQSTIKANGDWRAEWD